MVPGEMVIGPSDIGFAGGGSILSTTWVRESFADHLLGVAFYPEGIVADESHELYIDSVQLVPTAHPTDFDVPNLFGERWFLSFYKDVSGLLDETVAMDNVHGLIDGNILPKNFFCDYIHAYVIGEPGVPPVGTYTILARKGTNQITDGTASLQVVKTFGGAETPPLFYWDHEHFGPDNIGGAGRSGCRSLEVYGGVGNSILNVSVTASDDIMVPASRVYSVLSGHFIR